jgi:hypothetical protein
MTALQNHPTPKRSWPVRILRGMGILLFVVVCLLGLFLSALATFLGGAPYFWPSDPRPSAAEIPADEPGPRWYKGDLHAHSFYSDGTEALGTHMAVIEKLGLDFYCLTDHDNYPFLGGNPRHWFDKSYNSDRTTLLYGMEWTRRSGHANTWCEHPFDYAGVWKGNLANDPVASVNAAHEQGALFSINHPGGGHGWKYPFDGLGNDAVEIWNGVNCHMELQGRPYWDGPLKSGLRVTAVGGGDTAHIRPWRIHSADFERRQAIGVPTTWVYAPSRKGSDILDNIRKGHVTVSWRFDAPRMEFAAEKDGDNAFDDAICGDNLPVSTTPVRFRVRLTGDGCTTDALQPLAEATQDQITDMRTNNAILTAMNIAKPHAQSKCLLLFVYKDGALTRLVVLPQSTHDFIFEGTPDSRCYFRVEMAMASPDPKKSEAVQLPMMAAANPVYFGY